MLFDPDVTPDYLPVFFFSFLKKKEQMFVSDECELLIDPFRSAGERVTAGRINKEMCSRCKSGEVR